MNNRLCKMCQSTLKGRSDKIFCSIECKNTYFTKLNQVNRIATKRIDNILHRNRAILLEILGKNSHQKKIPRLVLDKKKFNFSYFTSIHVNVNKKMVYYVYDFSWMIFSDNEVLVRRKK